jgi:tetratricopeptide (TPR) repeat protein
MVKMRIVFLVFIVAALAPFMAQAATFQETLNQYISDLQKNPSDYALREKIIRHVQTMTPAPAIPLEAEKFEGRAEFAIKNAKTEADFLDAAKEYEKAVLITPWVPVYYFNQGIAYEKAGKLKEAKRSFEFYLLATPNAQDAREVRKRIAGLEYAMEKAVKESSPQEVAAKQQKEYEEWSRKIDGRRYRLTQSSSPTVLEVRGKHLVALIGPEITGGPWEIKGRRASTLRVVQSPPLPVQVTYLISEDGDRIIEHRDFSDGDSREFVWVWQR